MTTGELASVAEEIPAFKVPADQIKDGVNIVDLLADLTDIVSSNGDARRAIKGNAISVNKAKISSHETTITPEELLHGKYLMVENGKRNKYIIIAE
jgi:tyrosyl-tRNA synthetase